MMSSRTLITVADDFGLSVEVNEAIEAAARRGMLTSASLMVAGDAAADAVRRAKALGGLLQVGLHVVTVEGPATLPGEALPSLLDKEGMIRADQVRLAFAYGFGPSAKRQLRAEIAAQFRAFAATGLHLDHANAHKHMHLHPFVAAQMIASGRDHGLRAIRVPAEQDATGIGARALRAWTGILRRQARRAGLRTNDRVLGLADTGHMTPVRVNALVAGLRPGVTEMYFHPATSDEGAWRRHMIEYEHTAELAALLGTRLPEGVRLTTYSALEAG